MQRFPKYTLILPSSLAILPSLDFREMSKSFQPKSKPQSVEKMSS